MNVDQGLDVCQLDDFHRKSLINNFRTTLVKKNSCNTNIHVVRSSTTTLQHVNRTDKYLQINYYTQVIGTVVFTANYLKFFSSHDFSLTATWAGHWLLGRPKQLLLDVLLYYSVLFLLFELLKGLLTQESDTIENQRLLISKILLCRNITIGIDLLKVVL